MSSEDSEECEESGESESESQESSGEEEDTSCSSESWREVPGNKFCIAIKLLHGTHSLCM